MNQELKDKISDFLEASRLLSENSVGVVTEAIASIIDAEPKGQPTLPVIGSYGQYSNGGYGKHCLKLEVAGLVLYYSYRTIVAYQDWTEGKVVRENDWSTTTGKHLNWIDGGNKKARLPGDIFRARLNAALIRHGLREEA